jgi:FAD/FMN-containing dehydrogenase
MRDDGFIQRLARQFPPGRVRLGGEIGRRHEVDYSRYPPNRPMALLLPHSTQEVAGMLALCSAAGQPVVPQGGMTGTNAGAHPEAHEVALSLERMSGVEEIDAAGVMTVLAGTTLQEAQQAAEKAGYLCGIDIGARGSCTIGGNIATNAGGNQVIRYGMARDNVLGLEVVLADGRVLKALNKLRKNNSGYDLKHLFIGSEGTLGVITRATLQLHPLPVTHECAFIGLNGYPAVLHMLRHAPGALADNVSSFEILWPDYHDFMTGRMGLAAPLRDRHPVYLLLDVRGFDPADDRSRLERFLGEAMEQGVVADAVIAQSTGEITRLWALREGVSEIGSMLPRKSTFDVSFPIDRMDEAVAQTKCAIETRWPTATSLFFGHIGDGNVHLIVSLPDDDVEQAKALDDLVFSIVRDFGGAIAAEHGIGRKRRPYLPYSRTAEEIDVMRAQKALFDPQGILNPNKVV